MPVCWEPSYWIHIQSRYMYILQYYYCRNFLPTENDYSTVNPTTVNLHKGPSPTVRKAKLCLWRKYILRAEGGISCVLPWKCSLTQIRREQKKMPGPLLLVYFMGPRILPPVPSAQRQNFYGIKGTVSRDFRCLVFFMNQFPPSPWVYH
jgi:hypothetical protein